jgi:hypothetical protein
MSANRNDLLKQMQEASAMLLEEKGCVSFVDVLMRMEKLTKADHDAWRFGKTPCLESVITVNLAKIGLLLRSFQQYARSHGLRSSKTAYLSWGKGPKRQLRFSKSGAPTIEEAYATHAMKQKEGERRAW